MRLENKVEKFQCKKGYRDRTVCYRAYKKIVEGSETNLVDMVMNVLASNDGSGRARLLGSANGRFVMEASGLLLKASLDGTLVPMVVFPVLNADKIVRVLLGKDLAVLNRLHRGVIVILVDFAVYGGSSLFMPGGLDGLVRNCRSHLFMDGGVVVASFVPVKGKVSKSRHGQEG